MSQSENIQTVSYLICMIRILVIYFGALFAFRADMNKKAKLKVLPIFRILCFVFALMDLVNGMEFSEHDMYYEGFLSMIMGFCLINLCVVVSRELRSNPIFNTKSEE